jgi:hypothetical protein
MQAQIEHNFGPTLFVGDSLLGQFFRGWERLTGAKNSAFFKSYSLVNSYTLMPMGPEDLAACEHSSVPWPRVANATGVVMPCPPLRSTPALKNAIGDAKYLTGGHSVLSNLQWTEQLLDKSKKWETLVLMTGHHWWKEQYYISMHEDRGCKPKGATLEDAFKVVSDQNATCETFGVKYPIMVENVARFLATSGFKGRVVFVTSPQGEKHILAVCLVAAVVV